MRWITRDKPKIDRIACPWLVKRHIDREAEFYFVPSDRVNREAKRLGAIPFDVPDAEYTHYRDLCTFDYFLKKHELKDPALETIALIVRGADTDRHDLAPQSAGLWAITAGMAYNIQNDQQLLESGLMLYDALYSWAAKLQQMKHTESNTEKTLVDVYRKFLKQKAGNKRTPGWVAELRAMIQDHLDADLSLNLKDISNSLQIHPSYVSREFPRHFDDLNYGEYLRKKRIEKALNLLETSKYSMAEIAMLSGFSDQSHFSRIFKANTGQSPSSYRKMHRINRKK